MKIANIWLGASLVAITAAQGSSAAHAQEVSGAVANPNDRGIEDIVVTARRTAENLQRVPVAVTAFTAATLQDRSIANLDDVVQSIPAMVSKGSGTGGSAGQYFLRGIGQGDFTANTDPGVALYVDGVYYARVQGANLDIVDIDRIEVLRGPQGTLYGKNAAGGLISYISRSPDAPERYRAMAGVSSRSGLQGQLAFNREVSKDGTLFLGASVAAMHRNGYGESVVSPEKASLMGIGKGRFFDRSSISGRLSLLWRPSDALSFLLRGDMTEQDGTGQGSVLLGVGSGTITDQLLPAEERAAIGQNYDRFYSDYRAPNDLGLRGISLTSTLKAGGVDIKSITAYRTIKQNSGYDFDSTSLPIGEQRQYLKQNQFSQELQANGKLFSGLVDWIAGLYYLREELTQLLIVDGRAAPTTLSRGQILHQDIRPRNKSYGAFASLDVHVTDRLTLNGAIRYTSEKKDIRRRSVLYPDLTLGTPIATLRDGQDAADFKQWTPKLGVNYRLADTVNVYATYSNGFRSGGFNIRPAPSNVDVFGPETVEAYEIGLKSDLFDRLVRLNVAAFHNDYKDIQLLAREGANIFTLNGGVGRIRGAEAELSLVPGGGFKFNMSAGYLDAKLTKTVATASAVGIVAGNRLPFAPKWTLSTGAEYGFDIGADSRLTFRVDTSYRASMWHSASNNPFDYAKSLFLANGRVTLRHGAMNLSAYAINLFDKNYFILQGDNTRSANTGFAYGVPAEPRRIGLELSYDF